MVADMVAFVASQFTTSTWDVGAQELCSVVLISEIKKKNQNPKLSTLNFVIFLKNLLCVGLFFKKVIPFVLILLCPDGSYRHNRN